MPDQPSLFGPDPDLPYGLRYLPDILDEGEERALVAEITRMPFKASEFRGFSGKRRVVSIGWSYDFNEAKLRKAEPVPDIFHPVREKAASFASLDVRGIEQLLVTECAPGAAIGWRRDRPVYDEVIGVSLLAACTFRLRRKSGAAWERASLRLAPCSASLLGGLSREQWEHSVPAMDRLRYSLTFRSLRSGRTGDVTSDPDGV